MAKPKQLTSTRGINERLTALERIPAIARALREQAEHDEAGHDESGDE